MKVLMFFHGGSLNRGCEAIVRSSTKMIKERITDTKVYLVSGKPETDKVITSLDGIFDGADHNITKFSYDWFISSLRVKLSQDESYAYSKIHKNVIKHIREADVCLSIGGDNYCYGEQPGWYEVNRHIKAQGKKLILWGASIGEEDMSDRKLADLTQFDLIIARETLTYDMLRRKGLTNVKLAADPAFTMDWEELNFPLGWHQGNTVGLNFSPLVLERNKDSQDAVKELIQHIITTTDMTIALTPHVIDEGNNDYEMLHHFYQEYKETNRVIILPDHLNAMQYKGYISRMRFFIGARTHATIAAYSSLVPTMVLGYSVKSKGISKDIFGDEKFVLGVDQLSDSEKLKKTFDQLLEEEEEIKANLQQSIPQIKDMSYKSVDYLRELCQVVV